MQSVQHIVEHLVQRYFAHKPSFGRAQKGQYMHLEFFLRYTRWDSAHRYLPVARFFSYAALSPALSQNFQ
jgi:hypothetical protein